MFKQNLKKAKILSTDNNNIPTSPTHYLKNSSIHKQQDTHSPKPHRLNKKANSKHLIKQFVKQPKFRNRFQPNDDSFSQVQNYFNSANKYKHHYFQDYQEPQYDSTAPQFSKKYVNQKCHELIQNYQKSKSRERMYEDQSIIKLHNAKKQQKKQVNLMNSKSQNLFFTKKSRVKLQNEDSIKNKLKQMELMYLQLQEKYKSILIEAKQHVITFQTQKNRLTKLKENHFADQTELEKLRQLLFSKKQKTQKKLKMVSQAVQVQDIQIILDNRHSRLKQNDKRVKTNVFQEAGQKSVQNILKQHIKQKTQQILHQKQKHKSQMNWFQMQKKSLIQKSKQKIYGQTKSANKYLESNLNLSRSRKKIQQKHTSINELHSKSVKDLKKSRNKQQKQLNNVKRDLFNVKHHIQNLQRFKKNSINATNNLVIIRQKRQHKQHQLIKSQIKSYDKQQLYENMQYSQKHQIGHNFRSFGKDRAQNLSQKEEETTTTKIIQTPIAKLLVKKSANQNGINNKYKFKPSGNI